MRVFSRIAATVVAFGLVAGPALAQLSTQPVYFSPKHGTGLTIAGDFGAGLSDDAKFAVPALETPIAYGGRATLGLPMFSITAGVAIVDPGGSADTEVSFGGNVAVNVFNPPLAPVAISLQAGVGYTKFGDATAAELKFLNIPIGVALAISVPSPAATIEPWIAPRIQLLRSEFSLFGVSGGTETQFGFGVSGGLNITLPMGLGFHVAADWVSLSEKTDNTGAIVRAESQPLHIGGGVHYKIAIPSLGVPGM